MKMNNLIGSLCHYYDENDNGNRKWEVAQHKNQWELSFTSEKFDASELFLVVDRLAVAFSTCQYDCYVGLDLCSTKLFWLFREDCIKPIVL